MASRKTEPKTEREWTIWRDGLRQGREQGRMEGREELAREFRELLRAPSESHSHAEYEPPERV
jgi:hypothetical protein